MNISILNATQETTIWEDFCEYLREVFTGADGYYGNLGLEPGNVMSVSLIALGIYIGIVIACIAMAYNKQVLGALARKILSDERTDASKAATLEELGYHKNPFIRGAVQKSVSLRRVVKCVEEDEFYENQRLDKEEYEKRRAEEPRLPKFKELEYRVDPSRDHFYIPEKNCEIAERKFYSRGSGWGSTVFAIVLISVAFFVIMLNMPKILDVLDSFVGNFKTNDPYSR